MRDIGTVSCARDAMLGRNTTGRRDVEAPVTESKPYEMCRFHPNRSSVFFKTDCLWCQEVPEFSAPVLGVSREMRYDEGMVRSSPWIVLAIMLLLPCGISAEICRPTQPDMLGPFYTPDAPVRSRVGTGYTLTGTVKSSADCSAIPKAKLEFWMAGPDGEYADAYRAILVADASGAYRFESHVPPAYFGRPPHIHLRVSAPGFRTLVTQHYPAKGGTSAVFDIVLIPEAGRNRKQKGSGLSKSSVFSVIAAGPVFFLLVGS